MTLSTAEIQSIRQAVTRGNTVAGSVLFNLVTVLHDKMYSSNTRKICFKLLAALARNGQHLPDEVFDALLIVLRDETEADGIRRVAAFVLMSSLADGYKHAALTIARRDSCSSDLSEVLQKDSGLFIRTCVACALPYVLDKGAPVPEFLKFYLEDALDDSLIQPYVQGARERLSDLTSNTTSEDILNDTLTSQGGTAANDEETVALEVEEVTLTQKQKSLDELLVELAHNNPECIINASFAAELQSGLLRAQFEAIRDASQKHSALSLLVTHPTIDQWDLDTCAIWFKHVRSTPEKNSDQEQSPEPLKTLDPAFMPEMIAVLSRVRSLVRNQQVRDIQILSLLILLNAKDKGRITEIATGEGKTALVAMFAAFKALQARKVDVISSSGVLAHRDAEEERPFYEAMGITVADTEDPESAYLSGLKTCYLADVVYGDITFEWDALRTEYQLANTRGERPYDVAIVDEVDSMLIEEGAKLALLGGSQPDMEQLQPLLIALWARLQYENTPDHFTEEEGRIFWQANKESERIEVRDRLSCLKQVLEAHAKALISEKDSPILVPVHLKSFALAQAEYWAQSAVMASEQVHLDRDYVLSLDAEGTASIAPIDFMNTGVTQLKSAWTNGLHQFLQMKHGLVLTPETLTTSFISNKHYFSRYGSNLYGVTGTLGGVDSQLLLTEVYPLDLVFVPTFKEKQLIMLPGILAESDEIWLSTVVENVKRETAAGRAVLVICETNLLVAAVEKALRTAGILKLRRYARSDLAEQSTTTKPMDDGEVMIATSLGGRGTDLKTSESVKQNKGLHVCLTYLPNKRGRDQAFGRTARQGQEGSAQLIVNQKAIKAQFDPHYFLLGQADTLENAILWRDKIEEARLEDIKQFELKKVALQERLFGCFSQLRKRLRTVENNEYRLADLEERWAFWLKNIDNQMLATDTPDEAIILDAYEQFEKEASAAYLERTLQNPGYWISEGNRLLMLDQAQAHAAYQEASTLDPVFAFPSYYAEALQHIFWHSEGDYRYKSEALDNLRKAKVQIETYLIPQIQTAQLMYGTSIRSDARSKTDLLKQYKDKEFLLQRVLDNIEESIFVIEHAPAHVRIRNNTSLVNLFIGDPPETEITAFTRMGFTHLVSYEEVPKEKKHGLWDAFLCTAWGMAQIVVGVCLTLSGQIYKGAFLISEGLGDIIHMAHEVITTGDFNWSNYRLHKQISLAISAVTWGIGSIKTAVAEQAAKKAGTQVLVTTIPKQMSREALAQVAKTQITNAVISAGIHEAANVILDAVSRETLAHFKEEIEAHVRKELNDAMSAPALQEAINTLLSLDFQNKNQRCEQQIQQIASSLLTSQQSRLKTIVSAVIDGVLRREFKALSVLKSVHNIAQVTSQLSDFCDRFCEEFNARVRFLAHKHSTGQTIAIEESYCISHRDALIISITNNVTHSITRALHHGVVRPIAGTLMDTTISQFENRVLEVIHRVKEPILEVHAGGEFNPTVDLFDGLSQNERAAMYRAIGRGLEHASALNTNFDEAGLALTKSDVLSTGFPMVFWGGDKNVTSTHARFLYRGDGRHFKTIFEQGFTARGVDPDIIKHVITNSKTSQYVATSSVKSNAVKFPETLRKYAYLYEINAQKHAIDVGDLLQREPYLSRIRENYLASDIFTEYLPEKEWIVPKKIAPHDIRGAWRLVAPSGKAISTAAERAIQKPFIFNPNYVPSRQTLPILPSLGLKRMHRITTGATWIGAGLDAKYLYDAYDRSNASGDYNDFFRESSRIAGGWSGAIAGGTALAKAGAISCAYLGPYGPPVCGMIGGIAGSVMGYLGGEVLGSEALTYSKKASAYLVNHLPCPQPGSYGVQQIGSSRSTCLKAQTIDQNTSVTFEQLWRGTQDFAREAFKVSSAYAAPSKTDKKINYHFDETDLASTKINIPSSAFFMSFFSDDKDLRHTQTYTHSRFLYRGDLRAPEEILSTGFTARGKNPDVLSHVLNNDGNFVSTSLSKTIAKQFPQKYDNYTSYLYEINAQKNAISMQDALTRAQAAGQLTKGEFQYFKQEEMSIPKRIESRDIRGAWPVKVKVPDKIDLFTPLFACERSISEPFIANPNYVPSRFTFPSEPSLTLKAIRRIGHGVTMVGMAIDAFRLFDAYQSSKASGDYNDFFLESSRIAGGWSGAIAGGTALGKAGAISCAYLGPYGPPVCGMAGGIAGSVMGYLGGEVLGSEALTYSKKASAYLVNHLPCPQPGSYGVQQIGLSRSICPKPQTRDQNASVTEIHLYDDVYLSKFDRDELAITTLKEMHDKYSTTDIAVLLPITPDIKQLREKTNWNSRYGFFCKPDPSESTEKRFSSDRPCVF